SGIVEAEHTGATGISLNMQLELILKENNAETARLKLGMGEFVLGRDTACEVQIPSDAVSRRHARLTVGEDGVFIQDLGSANGTYVDGQRAEGRVALLPGQHVEIGLVVVQARWDAPPGTAPVQIETYTASDAAEKAEALLLGRKYDLG